MKKLWIVLLVLFVPVLARAAEFFCSNVICLIAAINEANTEAGADTINLEPGTYALSSVDNLSQFGANGLPVVTSEMTINGDDALTTILERDPAAIVFRILEVAKTGNLTLNRLRIRGGDALLGGGLNNQGIVNINESLVDGNSSRNGGGISNFGKLTVSNTFLMRNFALEGGAIMNSGTASISSTSVIENAGEGGGGIRNIGTMTVQNAAVSDNGGDAGGGILNSGTIVIKNSSIANNRLRRPSELGTAIFNRGTLSIINTTVSGNFQLTTETGANPVAIGNTGIAELQNSIVALNASTSSGRDCFGPITSLGNNIIGDPTGCTINLQPSDLTGDPGLGTFVDDETPGGGHFPLLENSPAIDRGNNDVCSADPVLSIDQLGRSRVGPCDIGAVEFEGPMTIIMNVRPRRDSNRINVNSTRNINVALLSAEGFDATLIDPNTVRFGATGLEAAPIISRRRDVNGDGQRDLVVQFQISDLEIECGTSSLKLTGNIPGGQSIISSSPITTTGCK